MSAGTPDRVTEAERFEVFVRAHQDLVFATAVRLLGRGADAEDVSQDVFLKAFERFDVLGRSAAAAGWLRTVTRNACLNHLTRHRARWQLFSELPGADAAENPEERVSALAGAAPSQAVDLEAQQKDLHAALFRLPDAQRVPLVLYHFEDMSYQDIADLLDVSLGKVKTDIHRGRNALKRYLTHEQLR